MIESDFELVEGSGNIFRDFDDRLADLKHAKAILAARIIATLDDRELPVREAEKRTGLSAEAFSRVRNADLGRLTLDWLWEMLSALDQSIKVTVHVGPWPADQAALAGGIEGGLAAYTAKSPTRLKAYEVETTWLRILEHAGEEFRTVRGFPFTYEVRGTVRGPIRVSRDGHEINWNISRASFEKAIVYMPCNGPSEIGATGVAGRSYVWAILSDGRIS